MTLKTIDNLSDGLFVDWEILNKLIYNIKQVDADVPTVLLHSTSNNKQVDYNNKGASGTKMSIECGRKRFTNVRNSDIKVIEVKTSIDGGAVPCVLVTVEKTTTVSASISNLNSGWFKIHLKNSSSTAKSGYVNWMVVRARS
jgi:hypothetical protein